MASEAETEARDVDTDHDRYRNHEDALRAVLDSSDLPIDQIDRYEMGFLANGEVTVRWRPLGSEEWDGFVLT